MGDRMWPFNDWRWHINGPHLFVTDFGEARIPDDVPWNAAWLNKLPCDVDAYFADVRRGIFDHYNHSLDGHFTAPAWAEWDRLH